MKPAGWLFRAVKGNLGETLEFISIAVILAIVIRIFLFEPFFIPSQSMSPFLQPGDKIIINKIVYRISGPKRGDIVVFRFPLDEKKDYIKRIIGLPGDTIEGRGNRVIVNGKKLEESYLPNNLVYQDFGPVNVPEGEYFVMGDNRADSQDSRYWGTLKRDLILGKAAVIYWPVSRVKRLS